MKVVGTRGRLTLEQVEKQTGDIRQRSITPDTHKARVLVNQEELANLDIFNGLLNTPEEILSHFSQEVIQGGHNVEETKQEEEFTGAGDIVPAYITEQTVDYLFYVDAYSYDAHLTSRVLHFGINTFNKSLGEQIRQYNEPIKSKLESVKSISYDKIQSYKESIDQVITEFEKNLVDVAINYLTNLGYKTVLLDIFDRDVNRNVKFEDDNPKTHTVVLYKQDDKYLVIDPTNANFSQFLIGANDNIRVCFTGKKALKIYEQHARDCVDVAVKLAFNLNYNKDVIQLQILKNSNKTELIEVIDLEKLKNSTSIKDITNQQETYKWLPLVIADLTFRVKQSSNIFHSKKITKTLVQLGAKLATIKDELIKRDCEDIYSKVEEKYVHLLSQAVKPEKYNPLINCIIGYYQNEICGVFKEQDVFLMGELYKIDQQELGGELI